MAATKIIMRREFQPTPSAWRVTAYLARYYQENKISTHTLRVEGDVQLAQIRRKA